MLRTLLGVAGAVGCLMTCFPPAVTHAQEAKSDSGLLKYTDDKYEFSISVDANWENARLQGFAVPGVARVAYSGKAGACIVVFIQEPDQDFAPRFLVDESAKGLEHVLGVTTQAKEVRSVAGKQAMWLVVQGKGTGSAIDGKGDIPTTQHWVAIPRQKDIVIALLTCPTADYETLNKSFAASLEKLVVGGQQTAAQSASK
jgi:hypothetical protein